MSLRLLANIHKNVSIAIGISTQIPCRLLSSVCQPINSAQSPVSQVTRTLTCNNCLRNKSVSSVYVSQSNVNFHITSATFPWSTRPSAKQYATLAPIKNPSYLKRMKEWMGFTGKLRYRKSSLLRSSLRMYLCCAELVQHEDFFKEFSLPDTFNSWFRITELHIWMVMCRLSSEQKEGVLVRNDMIRFMWEDMSKKAKKLGGDASLARQGVQELSEQFRGQMVTYDEGILDDDKVLAGALWRGFFDGECEDLVNLEHLVHYVRKQMQHLDRQESGILLSSGLVDFLPLTSGPATEKRTKVIMQEILKRA